VNELDPDPGAGKLGGANLAVMPDGKVLQAMATAELNPPLTVTFTWTPELAPCTRLMEGADVVN
jgi:hypothetical protein